MLMFPCDSGPIPKYLEALIRSTASKRGRHLGRDIWEASGGHLGGLAGQGRSGQKNVQLPLETTGQERAADRFAWTRRGQVSRLHTIYSSLARPRFQRPREIFHSPLAIPPGPLQLKLFGEKCYRVVGGTGRSPTEGFPKQF